MNTERMISAVTSGEYEEFRPFVKEMLNPKGDQTVIEEKAREALKHLNKISASGDLKRYKFVQGSYREKALEVIFNQSFKSNSGKIIEAAEQFHPSSTSFYPRWKTVCWIQIPRFGQAVIDNPISKIILTIHAYQIFYRICINSYETTTNLTQRSLPSIINNTPAEVVRLGNNILDLKDCVKLYMKGHLLEILMVTWVAREVILSLPEIPGVTPLARKIDLSKIFLAVYTAPGTIISFLFMKSLGAATFTWRLCSGVADFLEGRVSQVEAEKHVVCKPKAYEVWKSMFVELKN